MLNTPIARIVPYTGKKGLPFFGTRTESGGDRVDCHGYAFTPRQAALNAMSIIPNKLRDLYFVEIFKVINTLPICSDFIMDQLVEVKISIPCDIPVSQPKMHKAYYKAVQKKLDQRAEAGKQIPVLEQPYRRQAITA